MKFWSCQRVGMMLALSAVLSAAPTLAQDRDVIPRGSDGWTTAGDGSTVAEVILPAGFLDRDCPAYHKEVVLKGVPVETSPEGAFGNADTIIERLGDAAFDERGVATTKIAVRALHFRAVDDLGTGCGEWSADVGLDKNQAVTEMTIVREDERGGYFTAPIAVNSVWTFRRASDGAERQLRTSNVLTSDDRSPWQSQSCSKASASAGSVLVGGNAGLKVAAASISRGFNPGYVNCQPVRLCRGKVLDPAIHCYTAASAASTASASK
jgi:hypothetical protein